MLNSEAFVQIRDRVNAAISGVVNFADMGQAAKWSRGDQVAVASMQPLSYQLGGGEVRQVRPNLDATMPHEEDVERTVDAILAYFGERKP